MAVETGVIPPSLKERPILQGFDTEVWNAFTRLSARRNVSGFGAVGAIPYIEIAAYIDLIAKIENDEDKSVFIELVEYLDSLFLKEYAEKQRQESAKAPKKRSKS